MIDALEAMETLLRVLEREGGAPGPQGHQRIRTEIQKVIDRSGSAMPADAVCHAIETGDVKACRESGITLGGLVVWSVALRDGADSVASAVSHACDAGVGYLFALPDGVYRRAGISHECRREVLLNLELMVRQAINQNDGSGPVAPGIRDKSGGCWSR
jgi:hypothetical protein